MTSPGRGGGAPAPTAIADGKVTGSQVSLNVVRDFGGNAMTMKYSGTATNGAIMGKIEMHRPGEPVSRDWEARLQK